ncbi:unnamed protein product [Rhizophagus irregularis]|nr:unnamed protein product [Rhizophagus irregularis]
MEGMEILRNNNNEQLEIRHHTKQKLELIESQKTIEPAEIERMKVTQLRNNTESVTKIHQHKLVKVALKPDDENAGYESEEYDLDADCEIRSLTRNGKNWKPTSELVQHEQFTEGVCTRAIVRKSYVSGRYDPYYHEAHYITQQILTHFSVRLEVPMRAEYKGHELERTFAIDTIVYILNRLFRMHQDELDVAWLNKLLQTQKTTNLMDYTR